MCLSGSECLLFLSVDVFDLALSDSCLQENEDTTTENGINPELAKVGCYVNTEQEAVSRIL